jgi:hypothetical protein
VGRLCRQVNPLHEAISQKIVLGIIHLSTKNAQELKRTPEMQEEDSRTNGKAMEAPTDLYEPTISSLGPIGHVNLLLDVKVINS